MFSEWFQRFRKDFTTKEFIPIKILSIFIIGGATSLFPFLSIYARSLGIKEQQLGILYSVFPVIGIVVPMISGIVADKIGNFKICLASLIVLSGAVSMGLVFVPPGVVRYEMPEFLPLSLNCSTSGTEIEFTAPYVCEHKPNVSTVLISARDCHKKCALIHNHELEDCHSGNEECLKAKALKESFEGHKKKSNSKEQDDLTYIIENMQELIVEVNRTENFKKYIPNLSCPNLQSRSHLNETLPFSYDVECWIECEAVLQKDVLCTNDVTVEEKNTSKTFALFASALLAIYFISPCIGPMTGGATLAITKKHKGDLGFQMIYLNIGMVVFTPIAGLLLDAYTGPNNQINIGPAVYLYFGMYIASAIVVLFLDLDFKKPSEAVISNLKILLTDLEVIAFLMIAFVGGACFGYLETFLFWFLEDLGANKKMMSITITVGAAAGIPVQVLSTPIIKKLGHANTISLTMAIFVIRFIGYTFITNPWQSLIFEVLEAFTLALMGVASQSYICELTSQYNVVTLQGIHSAMHWGVGRGFGSLLGGIVSQRYGLGMGFTVMAVVCGCVSLLFFLSHRLYFQRRKKEKQNEECNDEKEKECKV